MTSPKKNQLWLLIHVASISSLTLLCTLPGISGGADCPEPCPSDFPAGSTLGESRFSTWTPTDATPASSVVLPLDRMVAVVRGPVMSDDMDDLGMQPDMLEIPSEVVSAQEPGEESASVRVNVMVPESSLASIPAASISAATVPTIVPSVPPDVLSVPASSGVNPVWLRPATMFALSYGLYLLIGILRKKSRKFAKSQSVVGLTLAAGALFGVGTYMMQGVGFIEALEMTVAGPLAISIHEVSKRLFGFDIGSNKT